jgi:hypothetical protein
MKLTIETLTIWLIGLVLPLSVIAAPVVVPSVEVLAGHKLIEDWSGDD